MFKLWCDVRYWNRVDKYFGVEEFRNWEHHKIPLYGALPECTKFVGMLTGADSDGGPGGPGPPVKSYDNYKIQWSRA